MVEKCMAWLAGLRGLRADLAALLLGLVAATALPPIHLLPVLLISVPGLLALINGTAGPWQAARRGWWFGFGHHLLGLYWVTEAILFEAARFWWFVPIAVPALAATLAVFIAAAVGLARLASPGWPRVLALAGAWVLTDLARQFVLTGFPWNPWGSVWELPGALGDVFIQPASLVGVHGLTLVTLLLAAVPVLGWRWRIGSVVVLVAWVAFGLTRLRVEVAQPASPVKVVLVQGNVAQGQKWNQALAVSIFQHYLALTEQGVRDTGGGPAVVVWPETAFPGLLQGDTLARQMIARAAGGNPALIGSVRYDERERPRNTLFAILDGGAVGAMYDKWHLVPMGEYQPAWFPLPIMVVPGGGFAQGPGPLTLHVPALPPVGALICYEAIFPAQVVEEADRPDWLVNVTNDAWFGDSTGPRQHLAAARMRAVEEGLPLMRAANTGITAAFDARGHELGRIGMRQTGTLIVSLPGAMARTLFARFGLWLPGIAGSVALALGLAIRRNTP